jgi:hypothetical protein
VVLQQQQQQQQQHHRLTTIQYWKYPTKHSTGGFRFPCYKSRSVSWEDETFPVPRRFLGKWYHPSSPLRHVTFCQHPAQQQCERHPKTPWRQPVLITLRGGGGGEKSPKTKKSQVFLPLAQALLPYLEQEEEDCTAVDVADALKSLAVSQQTLKGLDGVAHEAYQRTHTKPDISLHVSGRAMRTVLRTQAVAVGLGACELCELVNCEDNNGEEKGGRIPMKGSSNLKKYLNGTLIDKEILFHNVITTKFKEQSLDVSVLVLYQPNYQGGAGVEHGHVFGEPPSRRCNGQLLVVLGTSDTTMDRVLHALSLPPQLVPLKTSQKQAASVQPMLYRAACQVLQKIDPILRPYNTSVVHIVGHSLAGGVATILATILEGHLDVMKQNKNSRKLKNKQSMQSDKTSTADHDMNNSKLTVGCGWARGRTSAVALGAPPTLSSNVPIDSLVTNIVYGDDWVSRATDASVQRLLMRLKPVLKRRKSILTKQAALFTDTLKLASQGLTAHAHGREGEECRLASTVGSQSYLLRPRRYENHVSIHEMGVSSGREAIRAAVLWQLSDILLSPSYAKHHTLASYIDGLDRVYIRGLDDDAQADTTSNINRLEQLDQRESEDEMNAVVPQEGILGNTSDKETEEE